MRRTLAAEHRVTGTGGAGTHLPLHVTSDWLYIGHKVYSVATAVRKVPVALRPVPRAVVAPTPAHRPRAARQRWPPARDLHPGYPDRTNKSANCNASAIQ